jgi:hypothetical protein
MRVYELMQLLGQMDPRAEVQAFNIDTHKLHKTGRVYIGNERYIPGGRKNQPDVVVIDIEEVRK